MTDVSSIAAIPTALQSAKGAIKGSLQRFGNDASVVARSNMPGTPDPLPALIDSRQQLLYTKMAAKIIRASDEMTQSLLDIRA